MKKQGSSCSNLEAALILAKILLGLLIATAYVAVLLLAALLFTVVLPAALLFTVVLMQGPLPTTLAQGPEHTFVCCALILLTGSVGVGMLTIRD